VSWLALWASAVVQLIAAVVRARGWWHVVRRAREAWCDLRYRDVALAQVGGMGWNAILPAKAGEAVKVALVNRRLKDRRIAALASTLVPPAIVEAFFTAFLLVCLLGAGVMNRETIKQVTPHAGTAVIAGGVAVVLLIVAFLARRHIGKLVEGIREGLWILAHPRCLLTEVVPWTLAGRLLRLLAFALVMVAAGLPFGIGPAVALMALQGATPSAGAAATAARIALLAAVLSKVGGADVSAKHVATVLAAAYGITTILNLAASGAVVAWELRTASPKRVYAYAKKAIQSARERRHGRSKKVATVDDPYAAASPAPSTRASSLR
jgi:Lysylphosphatidylglycerol synthase TM region